MTEVSKSSVRPETSGCFSHQFPTSFPPTVKVPRYLWAFACHVWCSLMCLFLFITQSKPGPKTVKAEARSTTQRELLRTCSKASSSPAPIHLGKLAEIMEASQLLRANLFWLLIFATHSCNCGFHLLS